MRLTTVPRLLSLAAALTLGSGIPVSGQAAPVSEPARNASGAAAAVGAVLGGAGGLLRRGDPRRRLDDRGARVVAVVVAEVHTSPRVQIAPTVYSGRDGPGVGLWVQW